MKAYLDKLGSFGSLFAAAACPACFPQLAALGAMVGLGAFASYEGAIFLATKLLVAVAILGHVLAYRAHRRVSLLVLGAGGGMAFFAGMYAFRSEGMIYLGLLGMVAASVVDLIRRLRIRRRLAMRVPILQSEITCPKCGLKRAEKMPTDACQFFYECRGCKAVLRPAAGDCCVFCSYGTVRCPSRQAAITA